MLRNGIRLSFFFGAARVIIIFFFSPFFFFWYSLAATYYVLTNKSILVFQLRVFTCTFSHMTYLMSHMTYLIICVNNLISYHVMNCSKLGTDLFVAKLYSNLFIFG